MRKITGCNKNVYPMLNAIFLKQTKNSDKEKTKILIIMFYLNLLCWNDKALTASWVGKHSLVFSFEKNQMNILFLHNQQSCLQVVKFPEYKLHACSKLYARLKTLSKMLSSNFSRFCQLEPCHYKAAICKNRWDFLSRHAKFVCSSYFEPSISGVPANPLLCNFAVDP